MAEDKVSVEVAVMIVDREVGASLITSVMVSEITKVVADGKYMSTRIVYSTSRVSTYIVIISESGHDACFLSKERGIEAAKTEVNIPVKVTSLYKEKNMMVGMQYEH